MEDYNEVPFRQMVGQKIEKKDSERGAIEPMGFSLHGGKPIKELYRTVYTGGRGEGYCKEPVTKIHRTVTNDEGVSQKTMKSDESHRDGKKHFWQQTPEEIEAHNRQVEENVKALRARQNKSAEPEEDEAPEKKPSQKQTTLSSFEHKEASVRDMIAQKNTTGFVKNTGTGVGEARYDVATGKAKESWNDPNKSDETLMYLDAAQDALGQMYGNEGDDGVPYEQDPETGVAISEPTPNNPHMGEELLRRQPGPPSEYEVYRSFY